MSNLLEMPTDYNLFAFLGDSKQFGSHTGMQRFPFLLQEAPARDSEDIIGVPSFESEKRKKGSRNLNKIFLVNKLSLSYHTTQLINQGLG